MEVSNSKLVPPSTCVTCLGIQVDTVHRTISIPDEKLQDIKSLCRSWTDNRNCTKQQFQSILVSLLYITKCIKPARYCPNRILQVLRSNANSTKFSLNAVFYKDLCWFNTFLHQYDGVTYIDNKVPDPYSASGCFNGWYGGSISKYGLYSPHTPWLPESLHHPARNVKCSCGTQSMSLFLARQKARYKM